jgi:hypothetical protein
LGWGKRDVFLAGCTFVKNPQVVILSIPNVTVVVTVVPNCTTMRAGLLIAQLPQLSMWTKRDSKMKVISEFSVVFMQV